MAYSEPARTTVYRARIHWLRVAALLVVLAGITAALAYQLLASSSSTTPSSSPAATPIGVHRGEGPALPSDRRGTLGEADDAVPAGTTVFDDGVPGVAKLDPDLLGALRRAATDAADRVEFFVDSGWRSPAYQ